MTPRATELHVSFTRDMSDRLRKAAREKAVPPHVLVSAAMRLVLDGGLDALDGMGADALRRVAPGHGRGLDGLTRAQCAVLHLMNLNAGRDGVCLLSADKFALLAGLPENTVRNALAALAARGLIHRLPKLREAANAAMPHRLTVTGEAVAARISGQAVRGGEG